MTVRVAIIADDLTGALDSSVPFATAGLRTRVAVTPAALADALASDAEVIAVNTASRAMPAADAAAAVRSVATELLAARPTTLFKKIDSRLKGNVAAEIAALAESAESTRLLVAPAVPDQQRITRDGMVLGRGVDTPIAIAPLFAGSNLPTDIGNAETDADLDALLRHAGAGILLVGSRGLAAALARTLAPQRRPLPFPADEQTLFAFGTRDPITARQIDALLAARLDLAAFDLPQGFASAQVPDRLPALLRCTGDVAGDPVVVAARFGNAVASIVFELRPTTLIMGGGDTALAVLSALGARLLTPLAEPIPGAVAFDIELFGAPLRCLVKSGGFGSVGALASLLESRPAGRVAAQ